MSSSIYGFQYLWFLVPMISSIYLSWYPCLPVPIFPKLIFFPVLHVFSGTYVFQYLRFPVPMFPGIHVFHYLTFPGPMFSDTYTFPRTYFSKYPYFLICLPIPYVSQYLCFPVLMFHFKKRDFRGRPRSLLMRLIRNTNVLSVTVFV